MDKDNPDKVTAILSITATLLPFVVKAARLIREGLKARQEKNRITPEKVREETA